MGGGNRPGGPCYCLQLGNRRCRVLDAGGGSVDWTSRCRKCAQAPRGGVQGLAAFRRATEILGPGLGSPMRCGVQHLGAAQRGSAAGGQATGLQLAPSRERRAVAFRTRHYKPRAGREGRRSGLAPPLFGVAVFWGWGSLRGAVSLFRFTLERAGSDDFGDVDLVVLIPLFAARPLGHAMTLVFAPNLHGRLILPPDER